MTGIARADDFHTRRQHLQSLSDDELYDRFWHLVTQIVQPLLAEARTHTSPSIERSVLLRMGFSSLQAKPSCSICRTRDCWDTAPAS